MTTKSGSAERKKYERKKERKKKISLKREKKGGEFEKKKSSRKEVLLVELFYEFNCPHRVFLIAGETFARLRKLAGCFFFFFFLSFLPSIARRSYAYITQ